MLPIILTQDTLHTAPGGIAPQLRSRRGYMVADGGILVRDKDLSSAEDGIQLQKAILEATHQAWDIPRDHPDKAPVRIVPLASHANPHQWDIILVDIQWHWPALSCEHVYATGHFPASPYELHDPPLLAVAIGTFMAPFSKRWQTHTGGECTVISGHPDLPFMTQTLDTQLALCFPPIFDGNREAFLETKLLDGSAIQYLIQELQRALPASILRDGTVQASGQAQAKGRL
jgi:hypothetical protein